MLRKLLSLLFVLILMLPCALAETPSVSPCVYVPGESTVIRYTLPYHPVMYVAVALLHAGLALRLLADARSHTTLWQAGGLINVTAVIVFLLVSVSLTVRHARRRAARKTEKVPA